MKKMTIILVVLSLVIAVPAMAQRGARLGMGGSAFKLPPGKWWQMPETASLLGLTADEQARLDDLYVQGRRNTIDLKSALEKEKLELEVLVNAKTLDEAALKDRFTRHQNARTALAQERFNHLVEVRKLLGYDRFQQLKTEFQKRKKQWRKRKFKNRGAGQGNPGNPPVEATNPN